MKAGLRRYARSQSGFTLVELLVASAIGVIVMTGLTSLLLTGWRAGTIATSRVAASGQIRSFQSEAYDDFALSALPGKTGCGSPPFTCPIVLNGSQASNMATPSINPNYKVVYSWNQLNKWLERTVGNNPPRHAATNVSAFSWYIAGGSPNQTVVVTLTVTIAGVPPYSETQTLQFYPRVNP
jgi:prepilin-type N-terminal cleavage/methylation domain-containing protein